MGIKLNIETGAKFGRLIVLKELNPRIIPSGGIKRRFLCKCACGNEKEINLCQLSAGHTKSCGCYRVDSGRILNTKHLLVTHPMYSVYHSMKQRCNNKNLKFYKDYGGRGIKNEWASFEQFYEDMKGGYKKGLHLDRIDNNGNYSKSNCRWATVKQNNSNTRLNVKYKGETASEAGRRLGGTVSLIFGRLRLGWTIEEAFTTKNLKKINLTTK